MEIPTDTATDTQKLFLFGQRETFSLNLAGGKKGKEIRAILQK